MRYQDESPLSQLHPSEWALAFALIMALLSFTYISLQNPFEMPDIEENAPSTLTVKVLGAVENPGVYHVEPQTTLKEILVLAAPKKGADLRKIDQDALINRSRTLKIREIPTIVVHLAGAVANPGAYRVPKGTRLNQWLCQQQLSEDADLSLLQKKRYLKDNETLTISRKR